jgi:hypothetical protein
MKLNFQLSTEASLLLAQTCRQVNLEPEEVIEALISEVLRTPKNATSVAGLIGNRLQIIERMHHALNRTAELQEKLHNLLPVQ